MREPIVLANILVPEEYLGQRDRPLCREAWRAEKHALYVGKQVQVTYELPMAEVVLDFFRPP